MMNIVDINITILATFVSLEDDVSQFFAAVAIAVFLHFDFLLRLTARIAVATRTVIKDSTDMATL